MRKNNFILRLSLLVLLTLSGCSSEPTFMTNVLNHTSLSSASERHTVLSFDDPSYWQRSPATIWANIQEVSLPQLQASTTNSNPDAAAWIKLAIISKENSDNTTQLINQLNAWRKENPNHPGNQLFPSDSSLSALQSATPKRIALLLPLEGQYGVEGAAIRDGFMGAYFAEHSKTNTEQTISFYDTSKNPNIVSLYQEAISKGADVVIGPLLKSDVQQIRNAGNFPVPTIALNYSDSGSLPNNFYEFGLSQIDEAKQVADKAWQTGMSRALIIAPQSEWGQRVSKNVIAKWQENGGTITDSLYFNEQTKLSKAIARLLKVNPRTDFDKENKNKDMAALEQQRRQDFDVVFLIAPPQSAREIVPLLRFYYVTKPPIYATSSVYSGAPSPEKDTDLNGVIFTDTPWTLNSATTSPSSVDTHVNTNRLFAVGKDAYLISTDLQRFTTLPNFPIYGATGALTLTSQHQFYRRLPWAQFHEGHPT